MAAKTETPVSQFNLPKGAPFVPTKVPKLPKPTGQKRLETTQQPRQVGVQTPLELAAAVRQAAPATLPTSTTAAPTLPGVGTAATDLPHVPSAPAPEFAATGYGGGQEGATPEETITVPEPPPPPGHVSKEELDAYNAEKGYATGEPNADGDVPIYDADGNLVGWYWQHESGAWNVAWGDAGADLGTSPNQPIYGGDPTGGDPTGGEPPDPYADDYMLTAPDGTEYDATDKNSPYYDPKLDPTSPDFNPSLYKANKGWTEVGAGSDEAYQNQFDSMDAEAATAASAAKRAAMARYGAAGMEGSGQYMQEMGAIDQAIWAANETAKGELWVKKVEADRQADIDRVRADLEFATGEEANQLQITLQTMLDDKDKEDALREMYWGGSDKLKDIFGADSFDSESHAQFMQDMSDAKATGSEYAMEQVLGNIHYNNGELYYRSEWGDPTDTYVGPNGAEYESWFDYYDEEVFKATAPEAQGKAIDNIMFDLGIFDMIGESFEPGDSLPAQARVILEKFLLQNGMDPDFADDMWVMWGETTQGATSYPGAKTILPSPHVIP